MSVMPPRMIEPWLAHPTLTLPHKGGGDDGTAATRFAPSPPLAGRVADRAAIGRVGGNGGPQTLPSKSSPPRRAVPVDPPHQGEGAARLAGLEPQP